MCETDATTPVKTLRDEFAMAALIGLLANTWKESSATWLAPQATQEAYHFADAMLKARREEASDE